MASPCSARVCVSQIFVRKTVVGKTKPIVVKIISNLKKIISKII